MIVEFAEPTALMSLHEVTRVVRTIDKRPLQILHGVSLDVSPGESVAVVGRSGSGKSTLLSIMGMMDRPTAGTYRFGGRDVTSLRGSTLARFRAESLGFVFQRFCLMPQLTALENVTARLLHQGAGRRRSRRYRALELLDSVGLADRASHRPAALSGGEQQRVAIARALAGDPPVVLADEPTGSLDVETGQHVLDLLLERVHEHGAALVLVTHDPLIAERLKRTVTLSDAGATP